MNSQIDYFDNLEAYITKERLLIVDVDNNKQQAYNWNSSIDVKEDTLILAWLKSFGIE